MIDALPSTAPGIAQKMKVSIQTTAGSFTFDCDPSEAILQAGLRQGLALPYECATGTCGTCRARVIEGRALMAWHDAPGLAKLRLDKGDVLMCQARPASDCLLRVPANVTTLLDADACPGHWRGVIGNVRMLSREAMEFDVTLSRPMAFQPGQFAVLDASGVTGGRAYLMANFEPEGLRAAFVVKRTLGGGMSNLLFERDIGGTEIGVFGPLGPGLFGVGGEKDIVCICDEGGIAGTMSILQWAVHADFFSRRKAHVFFGVSTLADAFHLDKLAHALSLARGRLGVTLVVTDEAMAATRHPDFPEIALVLGWAHDIVAASMGNQSGDAIAFVAGTRPMVDDALRMLIAAGFSPACIRRVRFN